MTEQSDQTVSFAESGSAADCRKRLARGSQPSIPGPPSTLNKDALQGIGMVPSAI
jgi:hypothetical protein